jgi:hypothetical protein
LEKDSKLNIEIFSFKGEKMITKNIDLIASGNQEIHLSFENMAEGVYYCRIKATTNQSENIFTKKIILN